MWKVIPILLFWGFVLCCNIWAARKRREEAARRRNRGGNAVPGAADGAPSRGERAGLEELIEQARQAGLQLEPPEEDEEEEEDENEISEQPDPHAGESYAAPMPVPRPSRLVNAKTPAEQHVDDHILNTQIKDDIPPPHPSEVALHADAHIATHPAAQTPRTVDPNDEKRIRFRERYAPRTPRDIRRAVVMAEILGKPKGL